MLILMLYCRTRRAMVFVLRSAAVYDFGLFQLNLFVFYTNEQSINNASNTTYLYSLHKDLFLNPETAKMLQNTAERKRKLCLISYVIELFKFSKLFGRRSSVQAV